ncbi:hypothetical protein GF318_04470 [Candidatus Micrarchaeota archaeon]|nr:hypothetical protein [Candidatus Micrarchaeota archaeon]
MAKKKPSEKSSKKKVPKKTDIASVEKETIERVNRTISSIEEFLAKWEASKIKPDVMLPQVERIREFREALEKWEKKAVKGQTKKNEKARLKRLHDFVTICRTYS